MFRWIYIESYVLEHLVEKADFCSRLFLSDKMTPISSAYPHHHQSQLGKHCPCLLSVDSFVICYAMISAHLFHICVCRRAVHSLGKDKIDRNSFLVVIGLMFENVSALWSSLDFRHLIVFVDAFSGFATWKINRQEKPPKNSASMRSYPNVRSI